MHVQSIFRYPVKGLPPQPLHDTQISPNQRLLGDRVAALARNPDELPSQPISWRPKTFFLQNVREPALSNLQLSWNNVPSNQIPSKTLLQRAADFASKRLNIPITLVHAQVSFTDVPEPVISFLNLSSLMEFSKRLPNNPPLPPSIFRANILIENAQPWVERSWIGKRIFVGEVPFLVKRLTGRCAAVNADPTNGFPSLNVLHLLASHYGQAEMGFFAVAESYGSVKPGDPVNISSPLTHIISNPLTHNAPNYSP